MAKGRNIVIAVDHSDQAEYAFDFYVQNVYRDGDTAILVHVPEYNNLPSPQFQATMTAALMSDPSVMAEVLRETEERTRQLIHKYSQKMKQSHLSGHVKQLTGKTGEAIVEAVRTEEASMLIMGTRGMGKVRRTFLGSISDYCLHHSPLPVLICRHKEPKT